MAKPQPRATSLDQYWLHYYRTHDESSAALKDKVTLLNANGKSRDVEAILRGFLVSHSKNAETWMYEAIALAIKMNKGKPEDVKVALGFAADLAKAGHNPNDLVSVADLLYLNGFYDRVGGLLDEAMRRIPHRGEPILMSINLAQKTSDPSRMADSVERLLALGWPGQDEAVRRETRRQVETLGRTLREEGRSHEAVSLLAKLEESEARDVFIRLTWVGDAGLDLAVDEPFGATAEYQTPRTVFGGSIVKVGYGKHPESVYVCPRGFDGDYKIRVETVYNNPDSPALQATLEAITHEGTPEERKQSWTIPLEKKERKPIVVSLKGGRRREAMPFLAPSALTAAEIRDKARRLTAARARSGDAGRPSSPPKRDAAAKPSPEVKARPR